MHATQINIAGVPVFQAVGGTRKLNITPTARLAVVPGVGCPFGVFAMTERRALERLTINQTAQLSFDGIDGAHPCVVRNISAFGACISTPYYIFARQFALSFNRFDRIFICRIVWRKGTLCGVSFVLRSGVKSPARLEVVSPQTGARLGSVE